MPAKRFEKLDSESRIKILDAARKEFILNGYENASLNTIVRKAGISKCSLYYYFEDKLDLYLTVLKKNYEEILSKVGDVFRVTDNFWDDLENYIRESVKIVRNNPEIFILFRGLISLYYSPDRPESVVEFFDYSRDQLTGLLKRGLEMGAVRTDIPFGLLVNIINSFHEAFDVWIIEHIDELSENEYERLIKIFVDILKQIAASGHENE